MDSPQLIPFGDSAILVVFGQRIDPALNAQVHALSAAVSQDRTAIPFWGMPVPAYSSLLVPYEVEHVVYVEAAARLRILLADLPERPAVAAGEGDVIEIPVRYGGADGPDLVEVAARHGLAPAEVITLHSTAVYRVFMLGFAPGFAYLGPLPAPLVTPRRATPRPRVPAGSVAIAGVQTGVYPLATPGGWHILGRTDAPLWDTARDPPALLRPGAQVRFVPV